MQRLTFQEIRNIALETILLNRKFQEQLLNSLQLRLSKPNAAGIIYKKISIEIPTELFSEEIFPRYKNITLSTLIGILRKNFPGFMFSTQSYCDDQVFFLVIEDDIRGLNCLKISDYFKRFESY